MHILPRIARSYGRISQLRQIGKAPNTVQLPLILQTRRRRRQINDRTILIQRKKRMKNTPVRLDEKIILIQPHFNRRLGRIVIEHHRPKKTRLSFYSRRQRMHRHCLSPQIRQYER